MKKFTKILLIALIVIASMFASYENPKLVEIPKTKIKYFLKKLGLVENFFVNTNQIDEKNLNKISKKEKKEEFFANSFTLEIEKIKNLDSKTAGVFFDKNKKLQIFTQKGQLIENDKFQEINLPLDFTTEKEGGVRNVIFYKDMYLALLSRKKLDCYYASLIETKTQLELIKTKCIPDNEKVNFAGLGGGYTYLNNKLIFSIGTPTHNSEIIDKLAQDKNSLFGKIYSLENDKEKGEVFAINLFSNGHRNPQGLIEQNNKLYSTEHGPEGGDELNRIEINKNYGWPIVSLGTRYGGKSYKKKSKTFVDPIFSFLPAIAPSSLNECPKDLKMYYKMFTCLMGLTLREMSIIIYLLDEKDQLISYEKIPLQKRLRHFGVNSNSKLFSDSNHNFYFSADNDGIYKAKFKDFR